jgi:transposase InsO family protein
MTWKEFLRTHWEVLAATDFFTVELWTGRGLVRYHVIFVIKLATREVHIAGMVPEPNEAWMKQVARNLIDPMVCFLRGTRLLLHDRAGLFSEQFRQLLASAEVEGLRLPARSPNLNAFAERFVRTIREECLSRMIFFGKPRCAGRLRSSWRIITRKGTINHWEIESFSPRSRRFLRLGRSAVAGGLAAC